MWVLRKPSASKISFRRRLSLVITSLVVAFFAIAGPLVRQATAVSGDATWNGDTLHYDNHDYAATTNAPAYQGSTTEYQWVDNSGQPQYAYVIYFNGDAKSASSGTLITYTFSQPSSYTSPSSATTVKVAAPGSDNPLNGNSADNQQTSCNAKYFASLGWLICSVSRWIADGVDGVYQLIKQFLEVDTINQSSNGVYQIWDMVRSLANVAFIIIFLIIVYSQLTSVGFSNYNIKDMIPRLIIAAILVNASFWICQLFVEISNVLGYSIESLFMGIQKNLNINVSVGWGDVATVILSGGTIIAGGLTFAAAAGGSFASLGFILLGSLVTAGLSVLVAFIILAARQALVVILVMLAPLAFVAMVLPSTKGLFEKWRKALTTLLLFFPIFAVLFGGSELAGAAIINSQFQGHTGNGPALIANAANTGGGQLAVVLIGLAVQFVPLAITPLIVQFSEGMLGRIAGMANDRKRGMVDRTKNWAQSNAEDFKMRKLANAARRRDAQRPNESRLGRALRQGRPSNLGLAMNQGKVNRERRTKVNSDYLANRAEADYMGRVNDPNTAGRATRGFYERERERMLASHEYHERASDYKGEIDSEGRAHMAHLRQTDVRLNAMRRRTELNEGRAEVIEKDMKAADNLAVQSMIRRDPHLRHQAVRTKIRENEASAYQAAIEAEGEEAWKNRQNNTGYLRVMRTDADHAKKRAADIEASMSAVDQRAYDTAVNQAASPVYQRIRDMKVQTVADTQHAQFQASEVQEEGNREFRRAFEDGVAGARDLRKQNVRIEQLKKETGTIANTLQKRADAHWEQVSRTNDNVQTLRLNEVRAEEGANLTKVKWDRFIENVREQGSSAQGVAAGNLAAAQSINQAHEAAEFITRGTDKIKARAHSESDRRFIESREGVALDAEARIAEGSKNIAQTRAEQRFIESEEGQDLNLRTHAAQDTLETSKTEESARIQELRTEKGAEGLTGETAVLAQELREADIMKRAQAQRTANAQGVANTEYAQQIQDESNGLADIAGGIDQYGARRAVASATQTIIEDWVKNVKSEKSTMSKTSDEELLDIVSDENESDERRAAAAGKIMQSSSMGTIHKLVDKVAQTIPNDGTEENEKKRSSIRNIQQQMAEDLGRIPFGIGDRDRSALRRGELGQFQVQYDQDTGDMILNPDGTPKMAAEEKTVDEMTAIRAQTKLSGEAWASMDPDDRTRILNLARTPEGRALLGDIGRKRLMAAFKDATKDTVQVKDDAKRVANQIALEFDEEPVFEV